MGRRIIFRAKRLDNGEWAKGSLVKSPTGTAIVWWEDSIKNIVQVDPSTICQFTGLKDKDGKEVWEHDILKNYPMTNEVIFSNGSFMIIEDYDDDIVEVPLPNLVTEENTCCLEVIGNKFDRKEGEK